MKIVRPPVSTTIQDVIALMTPMIQWFTRIPELRAKYGGEICDFAAGNPREGTIRGYAHALTRWVEAQELDWFAYKTREPKAQAVVCGVAAQVPRRPLRPGRSIHSSGRRNPRRNCFFFAD